MNNNEVKENEKMNTRDLYFKKIEEKPVNEFDGILLLRHLQYIMKKEPPRALMKNVSDFPVPGKTKAELIALRVKGSKGAPKQESEDTSKQGAKKGLCSCCCLRKKLRFKRKFIQILTLIILGKMLLQMKSMFFA